MGLATQHRYLYNVQDLLWGERWSRIIRKMSRCATKDDFSREEGEERGTKGLSWKQAIQQTAFLEDQERDRLLNGWPWSMAIRMEHGIKMEEKEKQRLKTENQTTVESSK